MPESTLEEALADRLSGRPAQLLVVDNAEHLLPALAAALTTFRRAVPTATLSGHLARATAFRRRARLRRPPPFFRHGGSQRQLLCSSSAPERSATGLDARPPPSRNSASDSTTYHSRSSSRQRAPPLFSSGAAACPAGRTARPAFRGGRDTDPRQETLRATIGWSHDLLDGARAAPVSPLRGIRRRLYLRGCRAHRRSRPRTRSSPSSTRAFSEEGRQSTGATAVLDARDGTRVRARATRRRG